MLIQCLGVLEEGLCWRSLLTASAAGDDYDEAFGREEIANRA